MMRGYHMGFGFYGSYILIFLLIIIILLVFLILRNQSNVNPFKVKLINILKEKYASNTITADEFIERKSIIEDINYSNPFTPILLERYANCLISTQEFLNLKAEIESNKNDDLTCEALANGTLSYNNIKSNWRKSKWKITSL